MGGGWLAPRPNHFTPRKDPVPTVQEAEWAPEPVWTGAKISPPPGFDPRTVQPVTSRYTDCAIPALTLICIMRIKNQQNALNSTNIFYCDIFTYMFRSVIQPSSGWHLWYKNTGWSDVPNYSTLFRYMWLFGRIFCRMIVWKDTK